MSRTTQTARQNMDSAHENKMCPILWIREKYGLTISTLNKCSTNYNSKPIFRVPLKKFMKSGAFWSALNLCTIFWEQPLYRMNRDYKENEKIKGAYLIAFASDLAPICKAWANRCIHKIIEGEPLEDEVFVEIIVFDETLVNKLITAIVNHQMEYSVTQNIYTIIDNDRTQSHINITDIISSIAQEIHSSIAQEIHSSFAQEIHSSFAQEIPSSIAQEIPSSFAQEIHSSIAQEIHSPINDDTETNSLCIICMSNPSTHAFVPCGHKCICNSCYNRPNFENDIRHKCPTCRQHFSMIMQIFEN